VGPRASIPKGPPLSQKTFLKTASGKFWAPHSAGPACTALLARPIVTPLGRAEAIRATCIDVPRSVRRVCCNPVYMCIVAGACSHVTLVGFATFLTKYLHSHFGVSAALASVYTGISSSSSSSFARIACTASTARRGLSSLQACSVCLSVCLCVDRARPQLGKND